MDTFILISPGGISEGTRPEGPGKTPRGKAITASPSHHACHPLAGERACSSLSSYVCWAAWSLDLRHAHTRIHSEGREEGRKGERGGKGLLDILQCRPRPGRNGITASIVRRRQRWPPHCCASCLSKHKHTQLQQQWSRWIVGRPPVRARARDLGVTLTAAGPGEGINGFVSRSSIIPHPISLEPSNMARHSAGLALDCCTLLHHSEALLSSLGCLSYKPI